MPFIIIKLVSRYFTETLIEEDTLRETSLLWGGGVTAGGDLGREGGEGG